VTDWQSQIRDAHAAEAEWLSSVSIRMVRSPAAARCCGSRAEPTGHLWANLRIAELQEQGREGPGCKKRVVGVPAICAHGKACGRHARRARSGPAISSRFAQRAGNRGSQAMGEDLINMALAIAKRRRDTLERLREALRSGDGPQALELARQLCGVTDEEKGPGIDPRVH